MLGCLQSLYKPEEILACSFQGINAGGLNAIFPGRSFTINQIIYTHGTTCCRDDNPNNSTAVKNRKTNKVEDQDYSESNIGLYYRHCIVESVKVLIIEEFSNVGLELCALLLTILVSCASLCKIIIIGNKDQMPSIKCGNLIRAVFGAFEKFGATVEFDHNHRVDPESQILKANADAIRRGLPSSIKFDGKAVVEVPFTRRTKDEMQNTSVYNAFRQELKGKITKILRDNKLSEYEHHIITRTRAVRKEIQYIVEEYYHNLSPPNNERYAKNTYWVGRKYMFKQNNNSIGIKNNAVLILKGIRDVLLEMKEDGDEDDDTLIKKQETWQVCTRPKLREGWTRTLTFVEINNNDKVYEVPWDEWARRWIERASCTTVASFQGGQIPTLIHVQTYYSQYDTRETQYTAWTRPIKRLFYVGDRSIIKRAINNPEPTRRSKLAHKIKQVCDLYTNAFPLPDLSYVETLEAAEKKQNEDPVMELIMSSKSMTVPLASILPVKLVKAPEPEPMAIEPVKPTVKPNKVSCHFDIDLTLLQKTIGELAKSIKTDKKTQHLDSVAASKSAQTKQETVKPVDTPKQVIALPKPVTKQVTKPVTKPVVDNTKQQKKRKPEPKIDPELALKRSKLAYWTDETGNIVTDLI